MNENGNNDFKEKLKVDVIPRHLKAKLYTEHVENQKDNFIKYMYFTRDILWTLKQYRIVSDFTNLLARIKAIDSALKNDDEKALNDIFGMEIDTGSKGEAEFLCLLLGDTLTKTREVIHNKNNGYKAHHYSGYPTAQDVGEKLKEIIETDYDQEEMYKGYIDNVSERTKEKWVEGIEDEEERNQKIKLIEESIKKYYEEYYGELNKKIVGIRKRINGERLDYLCEELDKIENHYYPEKDRKDDYQPIIEIQYKTIAIATDCNSTDDTEIAHGYYKGEKPEEIQADYDIHGELPTSRLPIAMYRTNLGTNDYGEPKDFKELEPDEMATALHGTLIVDHKPIVYSDKDIGTI